MADLAEPLMVKYLHNKGLREGIAVSGTFELTQRCNFNCEMCYVHDCTKKADPLQRQIGLHLPRKPRNQVLFFCFLQAASR